ncbi:rod shape-determining protein [Actomonas aquatica]|uniref:Rod shape-determining protein n=1 Tax=Actomonas aquatica TaxID=2866162 RepID=A0ABZ1C7W7_9BACT|nr:rod shape-determining protein [Opitutus sp. WL0086]WRQ87543.1 rod shape-determining protein [Opitutus sp. WL0086]
MSTKTTNSSKAKVLTADQSLTQNAPLLVGFDWGTNMSRIYGAPLGSKTATVDESIPTVVGYAKDEVLAGVIPGDEKVLFGAMANKHKLHLNLVRPLEGGVIQDTKAARLFAQHIKSKLGEDASEVRAVIGMPASSDLEARENAREAVHGVFNKVLFVPEPFLAALGYREEDKLQDIDYQDPVLNSLYVDIGAGSADVCLVQGHYPTTEDQLTTKVAGDTVDRIILDKILAAYPDCGLTLPRVRTIKEKHSWVLSEDAATPAIATIMVGGKPRKIDVTTQVGEGCQALLEEVFNMTKELIARADPDSVEELLQNVIVTGGGSLIKGFGVALQTKLLEEGFENPRVHVLGDNYKDFVAKGALKTASRAREDQWQSLLD